MEQRDEEQHDRGRRDSGEEREWLAAQFEEARPHLQAVAYRMLGSASEAQDAVQESWLRLSRSDAEALDNLRSWLTTVVGRICLDMLRARRTRGEQFAGMELPEPIVDLDAAHDPQYEAELADSVGLALLVVLETLTPAERLAFVLHDMFDVSFEEIGEVVGKTPAAARQLASRARRRVRGAAPRPDPDYAAQRRVVSAFQAAARAGDFEALLDVLDPAVEFRADTGEPDTRRRRPVIGARAVARRVLAQGRPFAPFGRPAVVNGAAGIVVVDGERLMAVVGFTVVEGRIAAIDVVADPAKLRGVHVRR